MIERLFHEPRERDRTVLLDSVPDEPDQVRISARHIGRPSRRSRRFNTVRWQVPTILMMPIGREQGDQVSFSVHVERGPGKRNKLKGMFTCNDPAAGLLFTTNKITSFVVTGNTARFTGTVKKASITILPSRSM
jgi:hypothetical protein